MCLPLSRECCLGFACKLLRVSIFGFRLNVMLLVCEGFGLMLEFVALVGLVKLVCGDLVVFWCLVWIGD